MLRLVSHENIVADNPVTISISTDGGNTYQTISQNVSIAEQVYQWSIPETITCNNCNIRVEEMNGSLEGISASFSITALPNLSFEGLQEQYCATADRILLEATPSGGSFTGIGILNNTLDIQVGDAETRTIKYSYSSEQGCTASIVDSIRLVATAVADFTYQLDNGDISFVDKSSSASTWEWNFGEGNTSTEQNPTHTFDEGTY